MTRNLFSPARLERVGIECTDDKRGILRCRQCGQGWQPHIKPGGGCYRGWWKCPQGCNRHFRNIDRPVQAPATSR